MSSHKKIIFILLDDSLIWGFQTYKFPLIFFEFTFSTETLDANNWLFPMQDLTFLVQTFKKFLSNIPHFLTDIWVFMLVRTICWEAIWRWPKQVLTQYLFLSRLKWDYLNFQTWDPSLPIKSSTFDMDRYFWHQRPLSFCSTFIFM